MILLCTNPPSPKSWVLGMKANSQGFWGRIGSPPPSWRCLFCTKGRKLGVGYVRWDFCCQWDSWCPFSSSFYSTCRTLQINQVTCSRLWWQGDDLNSLTLAIKWSDCTTTATSANLQHPLAGILFILWEHFNTLASIECHQKGSLECLCVPILWVPRSWILSQAHFPRFLGCIGIPPLCRSLCVAQSKGSRGVRLCEMRLCVVDETHGVSIVVPRVTTWRQY